VCQAYGQNRRTRNFYTIIRGSLLENSHMEREGDVGEVVYREASKVTRYEDWKWVILAQSRAQCRNVGLCFLRVCV